MRNDDAGPDREDDCIDDLELAGLVYSTDAEPGLSRRRAGRGFSYCRPDGTRVADDRTLDRIRRLTVPPAWTDVWICRTVNGHMQATGRDARMRKQYRYHDDWRRVRDESKFADLPAFGRALPDVRKHIDADLSRPGLDHDKVVALVLALMDRTLIRVGNEEYRRQNGTHGLTTLVARQVQVQGGQMRFSFPGKGGVRQEVRLTDRRLAALVRRCHELGGREVFTYLDEDDRPRRVDSGDCNDYLRELVDDATVKTFRTWGGSAVALESLATSATSDGERSDHQVIAAVDEAARRLGNTRAVARRAYVHPAIAEHYLDGTLDEIWRSSRRTAGLDRAERALLALTGT